MLSTSLFSRAIVQVETYQRGSDTSAVNKSCMGMKWKCLYCLLVWLLDARSTIPAPCQTLRYFAEIALS